MSFITSTYNINGIKENVQIVSMIFSPRLHLLNAVHAVAPMLRVLYIILSQRTTFRTKNVRRDKFLSMKIDNFCYFLYIVVVKDMTLLVDFVTSNVVDI